MNGAGFKVVCPCACGGVELCEQPSCSDCGWKKRDGTSYLDWLQGQDLRPVGIGPKLMHSPLLARVYERFWRPAFVSVFGMGSANIESEFEAVLETLERARDGWISDLSCGPGVMGRRLVRSGYFKGVVGLDISRPMLEEAGENNHRESTESLHLVRADVAHQPFFDASLSGAHAGAARHLWPDVPRALRETARTLRTGAPFVATTFFTSSTAGIGLAQKLFGYGITTRFFDENWLRFQLVCAGFENIRLRKQAAYGLLTATRSADRPISPSAKLPVDQ